MISPTWALGGQRVEREFGRLALAGALMLPNRPSGRVEDHVLGRFHGAGFAQREVRFEVGVPAGLGGRAGRGERFDRLHRLGGGGRDDREGEAGREERGDRLGGHLLRALLGHRSLSHACGGSPCGGCACGLLLLVGLWLAHAFAVLFDEALLAGLRLLRGGGAGPEVPIGGGAAALVPGPWHSSEAAHFAGSGTAKKPPSVRAS